MLDLFHTSQYTSIQWFFAGDAIASAGWQIYVIPRGVNMVSFLSVSGGGGGGGGMTSATVGNQGGGGAGGSGGFTLLVLPRFLLPDTVYVQVGKGGAGGTASNNGIPGSFTQITLYPGATIAAQTLVYSQGANQGSAAIGGGAGGLGASVTSTSNLMYSTVGVYTSSGGQTGGAGGAASANGTSITWGALGSGLCAGAGGGGGNAGGTGGNVIGDSVFNNVVPTISGGAPGQPGNSGASFQSKMIFTGGAGGGGTNGVAGNGGFGGFGCGGGGGGGGITGGSGGDGGNGFAIITTW